MSAFTIINDVSLELRRRIFDAMNAATGVSLGFTNETSNIVFSAPQETPPAGARLSVYLYHVDINNALRNQRLLAQPGQPDAQRLPPLPLELRYLATPLDDEETNHLILGRLLQFVYDNPAIDSIGGAPLGDSFGGGSSELRLTPDLMNVEQLSQLWNAFSAPFRLSLAFQVDVVAVDSARMPQIAPRVVDVLAVAGSKGRDE